MKISSHTIIVNDYPQPGEYLLYSTRTQAMVKIDQDLRAALDRLHPAINEFEPQHRSSLEHLHRLGMLVRDEQEEQEKLRGHLNQLKYDYNKSIFAVTILTTYGCNFKCTYCFEESSRTTVKLDFATQEKVIEWLKRRMERLGYQKLHLNYYGGEPLLNPKAIEHISGVMKAWCESKGLGFAMSLQTNGYLLTPELVDNFKKLNLASVRISLDGVKEDHDRFRPLRGGGGTFERIVQNIADCVDKIPIGISTGFEHGDVDPIERLLNYFEERGILKKLGNFIFSPIHPTLGPAGQAEAIRGSECSCNTDNGLFAKAVRRINQLLDEKGIQNPKSGMSTSTCPLTRENGGVTIDQEGRLFKCNSLLGHPELSVGDVFHDEFNEKGAEFRDLDVWKQCPVDCTYLPMCSGGCRLMSFVGGYKNFKVASCKKPYLNQMAPEFIKRDYEKLMAQRKPNPPEELIHAKT
jgi:uncharacterized protein